jgi:hypothetical protein
VRDVLRYARFHLSDGADIDGPPVLSAASLRAMRTELGPGGTAGCEIDGIGLNWYQRRTAEGIPVYFWTGTWPGQFSGLLFVPERGFALTLLTNADSAAGLRADLTTSGDWVLERFARLHNPPAVPQTLTSAQLAPYEGRYTAHVIDPPSGDSAQSTLVIHAVDGGLAVRLVSGDTNPEVDPASGASAPESKAAFYRDNYIVALDADGEPIGARSMFVPGPNGDIVWLSSGGELYQHMD